jgi:exonuclease VII small subunit
MPGSLKMCQKFVESRFESLEELINSMGEGNLERSVREFQERFGSKLPIN